MCVKNNKKLSLKNGASFKLTSIEKDKIIIGKNTFTEALFAEYFVVSYAVTNHKIQGLTIKENFNVYEWTKMTAREKYTAYSRTSDGDNVKINIHKQPNYVLNINITTGGSGPPRIPWPMAIKRQNTRTVLETLTPQELQGRRSSDDQQGAGRRGWPGSWLVAAAGRPPC